MSRVLLTAVLVISSLAAGWLPRDAAAEPFRVRVLCYNIHHGEGIDGRLDLERIAEVCKSVDPDVVALQEVDQGTRRTQRVDQPAELARLTNMQVVFEKNIDFEGGRYGNAVLSRLPIERHRNTLLPSLDDGEQRGVLMCRLRPKPLHQPLDFYCTHLDHRADDQERFASAQRINQLVAQQDANPAILAGDLNAVRDSRVLDELAKQWRVANQKPLPTIPVKQPTRQIDFILFRPADQWRTIEIRVLDEPVASDHRPIFAVLEYTGPADRDMEE